MGRESARGTLEKVDRERERRERSGREEKAGGERGEVRARERGEGREERGKARERIFLKYSYTFIYLHLPFYTFIRFQIAPDTFIYPRYFKIFNICKMRADVKHKNGHISSPRASPKVRT